MSDDVAVAVSAQGSERPESARKEELLKAAYRWVLAHSWAGLSLRPLAEAIGSSPRVLLYLFGSKDGLIRALLARSRAEQLAVLGRLPSTSPDAGIAETGRHVWAWLAASEHRALLRLWVEAYSRSLVEPDGPWGGFAAQTVADWDDVLAAHQPPGRRATPDGEADRALLLSVLRGALLELLATDDPERLHRAVERHLANLPPPSGRHGVGGR